MKVRITPNPGMHPHHVRQVLDKAGVALMFEQAGEYVCDMTPQQKEIWGRMGGASHRLLEVDPPKPEPEPTPSEPADMGVIMAIQSQLDELKTRVAALEDVMFNGGDEDTTG